MKPGKFMLAVGALVLGFTLQSIAQKVLPPIEILAVNYKYLNAANGKQVAQPIAMLERQAAAYDVRSAEFYEDQYDNYFVSFYIPEGQILAAYDKEGNLLRTAEKYKDVAIPPAIRKAVAQRFPNWAIAKDVYVVSYHEKHGITKRYKLLLENGDQRMRVRINENGEFL